MIPRFLVIAARSGSHLGAIGVEQHVRHGSGSSALVAFHQMSVHVLRDGDTACPRISEITSRQTA
jgi:hypothetical protein